MAQTSIVVQTDLTHPNPGDGQAISALSSQNVGARPMLGSSDAVVATWFFSVDRGALLRLVAGIAYCFALGLLARAFLAPSQSAAAYSLFWGGMALCYLGVLGIAGSRPNSPAHHLGALMLLGAALWLPSYLRSPVYSIFADELYHLQLLRMMSDLGTTQLPITAFPIPGDYPGLEFFGLSTMAATGLSVESTARLISLAFHMIIPAIAYLALAQAGLRPFAAFMGALIYCSNTSYYFFHSVFSYESLGILFYLLIALAALRKLDRDITTPVGNSLLLILPILGLLVTHHVSSLMATLLLVTFALVQRLVSQEKGPSLAGAAQLLIVLSMSWLLYRTLRAVNYLFYGISDRLMAIMAFFVEEQQQPRELFWNSQLPQVEQLLAYTYPVLLSLLIISGACIAWRTLLAERYEGKPLSVPLIVLGLFGAGAWIVTGPLILTKSSELIYRMWPFLFLGVALYAGLTINWLSQRRVAWLASPLALLLPALLLAGGMIAGDNQGGRFRTPTVQTAAGPEALTDDLIGAAHWVEREAGQLNVLVGSKASMIAFATFGTQRTSLYGSWMPFYTADPAAAQRFFDSNNVAFIAIDWRDTHFLPRYGHYFSQAELYQVYNDQALLNQRLPADRLAKFELMPGLQRVYDAGDIVLYRNRAVKTAAEAQRP